MGGLFGGGVHTSVGTSPMSNGMGQLEMMNATQQSQEYDQQGTYALEDAQMQAMEVAQQAHMYRENQAVNQENAGTLNQGSPLLNLEFTRSQGEIQANQILASGQAEAQKQYSSGLTILNEGRASLLGQQDQFITQNANASIQQTLQQGAGIDSAISSVVSPVIGGFGNAVGGKIASWLFP